MHCPIKTLNNQASVVICDSMLLSESRKPESGSTWMLRMWSCERHESYMTVLAFAQLPYANPKVSCTSAGAEVQSRPPL